MPKASQCTWIQPGQWAVEPTMTPGGSTTLPFRGVGNSGKWPCTPEWAPPSLPGDRVRLLLRAAHPSPPCSD